MKKIFLLLMLMVSLCAIVLSAGCMDSSGHSGNLGNNLSDSPLFLTNTDPNTVPIKTAYNQTVAEFFRFAIEGPYSTNPDWTSAALDPEPVILYDINGKPQYYEFYLRNGETIPGYFWTSANKIMGHAIFRIYEGAPFGNYSRLTRDAESLIKAQYPAYPILLNTPALYSGGYPHLCAMVMIRNTTSGADERIIVDAFTHEIVPDHPSEDYRGHEYAWSYLDSIPQSEYSTRIAQWDLQDSNATRVVEYAMANGIDIRLPLSEQNASIIRNYYAAKSADQPAREDTHEKNDDESYLKNDGIPITGEMIRENVVTEGTARVQAQSLLLRRQVDRPEIYEDLSYRDATIGSREPVVIEDITGRKLFYLFSVEHRGQHIDWLVTGANKLLGTWLNMPAGKLDFTNATNKARDIAETKFPGTVIQSVRHVYCNDATQSGLWTILSLYDPSADEKHRIIVDTWNLNTTIEKIPQEEGTLEFPSLFSRVETGESSKWIGIWNKENAKDQDLVTFARSQGIPMDRPLTHAEIVTLGTYISKTAPVYDPRPVLFNPLYPDPVVRPTLDTATRVWHEQSDWFSVIDVDASMSDQDIEQLISSHGIPYNYSLKIWPASVVRHYYLQVPETEYNKTFAILMSDGSVEIPEQVSPLWEYIRILNRENKTITIPVSIGAPEEANYLRLAGQGIHLNRIKTVYITYEYETRPKKAEQLKILSGLNADERVVFARKEYSG